MNTVLTHFTQYIFVYMTICFVALQVVTLGFLRRFQTHQRATILLISLGGGLLLPSNFQTKNRAYNLIKPIGKFLAILFTIVLVIGLLKTFFPIVTMAIYGIIGLVIIIGMLKFVFGIFDFPLEAIIFWNYIDKK